MYDTHKQQTLVTYKCINKVIHKPNTAVFKEDINYNLKNLMTYINHLLSNATKSKRNNLATNVQQSINNA